MALELSVLADLPTDDCWEAYALALCAPAVRSAPPVEFPGPMQILAIHAAVWVFDIEEPLEGLRDRWRLDVPFEAVDDWVSRAIRRSGVAREHLAVFAANDHGDPQRILVAAWNTGDQDAALFELVVYPHEDPSVAEKGTVRRWLADTVEALFDTDLSRPLHVSTKHSPQLRSILRDATLMREQLRAARAVEAAAHEAAAMSATAAEADAAFARWEEAATLLSRVGSTPLVWQRLFDDDPEPGELLVGSDPSRRS